MRRPAAILLGLALLAPTAALADYHAYCVRGRIQVDQRSPDEMRSQLGACPMSQGFNLRSEAENFARRNFGGVGGSCSCR
jgi:hypothetical protein